MFTANDKLNPETIVNQDIVGQKMSSAVCTS